MGCIYILTNPSFPEWVKIGYADDVEARLKQLNATECIPFSFRIYATYEVPSRLADKDVHSLIDMLAPSLRSVENNNGVTRKREFYNMQPEEAFELLLRISKVNGAKPPVKYSPSTQEVKEEKVAEQARKTRHHFDTVTFTSSLTDRKYKTSMGENGILVLIDVETGDEVPNFSKPSKKQIVRQALLDLGEEADNSQTLYQLTHTLIKVMQNQ